MHGARWFTTCARAVTQPQTARRAFRAIVRLQRARTVCAVATRRASSDTRARVARRVLFVSSLSAAEMVSVMRARLSPTIHPFNAARIRSAAVAVASMKTSTLTTAMDADYNAILVLAAAADNVSMKTSTLTTAMDADYNAILILAAAADNVSMKTPTITIAMDAEVSAILG